MAPLLNQGGEGSGNSVKVPLSPIVSLNNQPINNTISESTLLSTLRNLLSKKEFASQLRGPQGPQGIAGATGLKGDPGLPAVAGTSIASSPSLQPAFLGVIQPNPATNFSGATLFSATNLSSNSFTTTTAHVADLNVSGNSAFTGGLSVAGINPLTTIAESWIGPSSTTGIYFKGGNIGIGTTMPQTTLAVSGNTTLTGSLNVTGAVTMPGLTTTNLSATDLAVTDAITVSNATDYPVLNFNKYDGFGITGIFSNGKIVFVYASLATHMDMTTGVVKMISSTDGGKTWAASTTIASETGISDRNVAGGITPTGRLIVFYQRKASPNSVAYKYSDDQGTTWSAAIALPKTDQVSFGDPHGGLIAIGSNKILMSWYGSGTDYYASYVIESSDDGLTWSDPIVAYSDTGNVMAGESSFIYLGSNTILGLIRENAGMYYRQVFSVDNGANWSDQGNTSFDSFYNASLASPPWLSTYLDGNGRRVVVNYYTNRFTRQVKSVSGYATDLISNGTSAWNSNDIVIIGFTTGQTSGYPTVIHPNDTSYGFGWYYDELSDTNSAIVPFSVPVTAGINPSTTTLSPLGIGATGNFMIYNTSASRPAITIDNTGLRVGIGGGMPQATLDVNGGIMMGSGAMELSAENGAPTFRINVPGSNFTIADRNRNKLFFISDQGLVGIGTTTPLSKLSINGGLHVGGDSDAGDNNILADGTITAGTSFLAPTFDTVTGVAMNIGTVTQIGLTLGRVGVTTTISGSTITLGSATTTAISLGNVTSNPTLTLLGTGLTTLGGNLTVTGTAWTATPTISGLITAISGLTSNGTLTVGTNQNLTMTSGTGQFSQTYTGASDAHTITSSATGANNKTLNVSQTGATTGTDYAGYFSNTGASTTNVGLYATASGAGTNNYAAIFENGNVGIGMTNPAYKLDIASGDINLTDGKIIRWNGWATMAADSVNITWGASSGAKNLRFFSNGTANPSMYINTSGNVGIGTTTPHALLSIGGGAARSTTEGTNRLDIFDGTAPVGTLANGISIYSSAGEAYIMDAAGNATLQSPHDLNTNYWVFDSKNAVKNTSLIIDMEQMMKQLNVAMGWDYVHETLNGVTLSTTPIPLNLPDTFFSAITTRITTWLADAGNGIAKIFVGEINAKDANINNLCVADSNGKTCITRTQLDSLLTGVGSGSGGGSGNAPTPTCSDNIQNQDETGVDTGGVCTPAVAATLESIAITTPATKLSYTVGDTLDISGLEITGTYSDTTTKVETITDSNITSFNSGTAVTGQVLTITVGEKTTTYTIDVI